MSSPGLTLIEVVVALLVATLTMAAVARSAGAVRAGERDSELAEAAASLAERGLETTLARGAVALTEATSTESLDEPLGRFERTTTVETGPKENLWHVMVVVTPPRHGSEQSVHTLLRRPWALP